MRYLLDTSTLVDIFRGDKEALFKLDMTPIQDVLTSTLVISEIVAGMQAGRKSSPSYKLSESFVNYVNIEVFDKAAAKRAGYLLSVLAKSGKPIGQIDTLIAAHALSLDAVLVTANTKHFARVPGLKVENWSRGAKN
ncbi:MAG: PIN domain-containing protein [Rhodoluna sp.]|jgi:tRNA(fMet)-specific endonuclease VapC